MRITYSFLIVSTLILFCTVSVDSACSGNNGCVECLMASPLFSINGRYCKWCPTPSLSHHYSFSSEYRKLTGVFQGSCYDDSSSSIEAQNTVIDERELPHIGGCLLSQQDSSFAHKGWLIPGDNHTHAASDARINDRTQIENICRTTLRLFNRQTFARASSMAVGDFSASVSGSSPDQIEQMRRALTILQLIRRDLMVALHLRSVDSYFFADTFPDSLLKSVTEVSRSVAWKGFITAAGILIPSLDDLITLGDAAIESINYYAENSDPVMTLGGDANSHAFPDVTYEELYRTYEFVLQRLKTKTSSGEDKYRGAKELLSVLEAEGRETTSGAGMHAAHIGGQANEVFSHPITTGAIAIGTVTASIFTGGIPLIAAAIIGASQFAVGESLKAVAGLSSSMKLELLLAGVYNMEGLELGYFQNDDEVSHIVDPSTFRSTAKLFCDITDYSVPNHGCDEGPGEIVCMRGPKLFFPITNSAYRTRVLSSRGTCVHKHDLVRLRNPGEGCILDSDCTSGFCYFGKQTVTFRHPRTNVTTMRLLYPNIMFERGDMPVPEEHQLPFVMLLQRRLSMLVGKCAVVNDRMTHVCDEAIPGADFYVCPSLRSLPKPPTKAALDARSRKAERDKEKHTSSKSRSKSVESTRRSKGPDISDGPDASERRSLERRNSNELDGVLKPNVSPPPPSVSRFPAPPLAGPGRRH